MRLLDLFRRPGVEPTPHPPTQNAQADGPAADAERPEIATALARLAVAEQAEDERLRAEEAEREARHAEQAAAEELHWRVAAQRRAHGDDESIRAHWAGRDDSDAAADLTELDRQIGQDRQDAAATRRWHEQEKPALEDLGREEVRLHARAAVPDDLEHDDLEHDEPENDEPENDKLGHDKLEHDGPAHSRLF